MSDFHWTEYEPVIRNLDATCLISSGPRWVRTQFQQSDAPPSLRSERPHRAVGGCSSFLPISRGPVMRPSRRFLYTLDIAQPTGNAIGDRDQQQLSRNRNEL